MSDNPELQRRTFEVEVGDEADFLALQGLVRARDLGIRETTAIPQEGTPLTEQDLEAVSVKHFGSTAYGQSAASMLAVRRENSAGTASIVRNRIFWKLDSGYRRYLGYGLSHEDTPAQTTAQLERYVRCRLEDTKPPFPVATFMIPRKAGEIQTESVPWVRFEPGRTTVEKLADFVIAREYHTQRLCGAIGKAFKVLSHAAGIVPTQSELHVPDDFIERTELDATLQAALPTATVNLVRNKIMDTVTEQLTTGKPTKYGEVVLEGRFGFDQVDDTQDLELVYERVSRPSLRVIAATYGSKKVTPATILLNRLAG